MRRKTIRGAGGDRIVVTDGTDDTGYWWVDASEIDQTEEYDRNNVAVRLTITGARRLHAALGQMLATTKRRRK